MQRGEPHRSHEWRRYFFLAAAVLAVCGVATLLTSKQQEADCGGLGLRAQQRNFETAAAAQAPQEKQGNTGEGGAAGRSAPPDSQVKALAGRRVVVSLSTFPGRVEYVAPTIYSLTSQRYQPAAIYLWVALNVSGRAHVDGGPSSGGDAAAELPESAKQVQDQFPGLVKAQVTDDVGPATKLLPTLKVETDPDTIIITVDDDVFYHPHTIGDLAEELVADPTHPAVRSCEETFEEDGQNQTRWKVTGGICEGFQTADAGAAYLRSMWDDAVHDYSQAPEGCWHRDNVWLAGQLWLRGLRPRVIPHEKYAWSVMHHRPWDALSIQRLPDTREKEWECLRHFGWLLDKHKPAVLVALGRRGRAKQETQPQQR